ncbi:MAG: tetratricopeptide repeat protein [Vicinamibacterales bacterium]|jgi:tetratricopeptide (TPR) repeat protein
MAARVVSLVVMAAAVVWTFLPATGFAFLNWDDQAVILQNPSLDYRAATWAFTTTYMEHYQPLSWLVWAAIKTRYGLNAVAFHAANVLAHVTCVVLVWGVSRRAFLRTAPDLPGPWHDRAALAAALLYGLHPLRVEPVAWISALPYALALGLMLASLLAYMTGPANAGHHIDARPSAAWWVVALVLYAASLGARPVALGFPIVLLAVDAGLLKRGPRASVARVWPFAVLAIAAAVIESVARVPGLNDTPWLYRLQSAASAPFVYVWHTVAPMALTPLDLLPIEPVESPGVLLAALLTLAAASLAAWTWRHRWPGLSAAWVAYLALLAPAAGLVPSGLQVTADRYTYLPGVVLAIVIAGAGARWAARRQGRARLVTAAFVVLAVASSLASRQVLTWWSDSVSLWTRVVSLEPAHDVGLYNLGVALAAEGRNEEAAARYRQVLTLRPDHAGARANLDRLDAGRLERQGNDLATRGDLTGAAERYRQAVALDPQRTHSQASLGMALASLGRLGEALPVLREAIRLGVDDPAVPSALGVLLLQSGQTREARSVFETALAKHQNDVGLAHNLARLLATGRVIEPRDAMLALRLAGAVVEATGNRDPRAIETLAAALAANNRLAEAVTVNARAATLAAAQGDQDLAVQITARGRAYRNPGQ